MAREDKIMRLIKVVAPVMLCFMCFGCTSLPFQYRYSIKHRNVDGKLVGPFVPVGARSPTQIDAMQLDGDRRQNVTLELRGVKQSPDEAFNAQVTKWLSDEMIDIKDEGLYVLRDTIDRSSKDVIRGVVLRPLQRSFVHDLDTGETAGTVFLYLVLQSDGLAAGNILVDEHDAGFGWGRDFLFFQRKGQKTFRGYWGALGGQGH